MSDEKPLKEMKLGELVNTLVGLKDECQSRLWPEGKNHPSLEIREKHDENQAYNKKIVEEYEERRKGLMAELDRREEVYLSTMD